MTLTFLHLGDAHLCRGEKNADRLAALDYVIAAGQTLARDGELSAWLWPGDLTDAGMTIEIRNALVERVLRMGAVAPVVIVPGNHDPDRDLDFLAKLKTTWPIHVVTSPQVIEIELACDRSPGIEMSMAPVVRAAIACVPYPSKGAIVSAGTPHDQIASVAAAAFDVIFMELGRQLDEARGRGLPVLAIGHVNIAGAVASTGQPQIGTELEISAAHLQRLGTCPKLFNHIHKHQFVGWAVYAGSLCRMDYGETEPKGFIRVDIDHADLTPTDRVVMEFVPIPVPPMFHVEGLLSRDAFDWCVKKGPSGPRDDPPKSACTQCAGEGKIDQDDDLFGGGGCKSCGGEGEVVDWTGCDVRVQASYAQQERDVLDGAFERVREMFAGARRFKFEPIAVPDRALRAPEVVQAQSFDEKLRAMAKLANVAWTDRIEANAAELQRTEDGDAIVKAFEDKIAPLADLALICAEVPVES